MKFKEFDTVKEIKIVTMASKKENQALFLWYLKNPKRLYEVEFLDSEGYPKARHTLYSDDLEVT